MQTLYENVYKVDLTDHFDGEPSVDEEGLLYEWIWVPRMDYGGGENARDAESLMNALEKAIIDRCVIQVYGVQDTNGIRAEEIKSILDIFQRLTEQKEYVRVAIMEKGIQSDGLNEYHIDFSGCKGYYDWHDRIKEQLPYVPDFYGRNLDSLWDVITGYIDDESVIILHGTQSFTQEFAEKEMAEIIKVFRDAEKEYGKPKIVIES